MAVLEKELNLKVFTIPHRQEVPGMVVRVKVTKRTMYACVHQFRVKAGLMNDSYGFRYQEKVDNLVCDEPAIWMTGEGRTAMMTWFRSGQEPLFISKTGGLHLMNMYAKVLVRSQSYPLTQLMSDFGEDPEPAMLPANRLKPGQIQGELTLPTRF